jgi:hypothetical protein
MKVANAIIQTGGPGTVWVQPNKKPNKPKEPNPENLKILGFSQLWLWDHFHATEIRHSNNGAGSNHIYRCCSVPE